MDIKIKLTEVSDMGDSDPCKMDIMTENNDQDDNSHSDLCTINIKSEINEQGNSYNNEPHDEKNITMFKQDEESISCDEELLEPKTKRTRAVIQWNFVQKFENSNEADIAMKLENTWSVNYQHDTEEGKKVYYRCNKVKRRNPQQCSAKMYLLFENTSESVYMFKNNANHDHVEKNCTSNMPTYGLSDALKAEIDRMLDIKMKPKSIMESLMKMKNVEVPTITQLRAYSCARRRTTRTLPAISLEELRTSILVHTDIPSDPHQVFVICYQVDQVNNHFRFALTTKCLIETSKDASVVHADSTHKIIWQGFPVLVCGTTDQNRKFHPLCVLVSSGEQKEDFKFLFDGIQNIQQNFECSWNPKVLVSDAKNIQDAFLNVFGDEVVVRTCWGHVRKKIQERIEKMKNKQMRCDILADIDTLHSITHKNTFNAASAAFVEKYKDQSEFVGYFKEQWLEQNNNWFLGAAPNSPSTNNALESFIKIIKNSNMIRDRFPVPRFMGVTKELVSQWSTKYTANPEDNYFAKIPSISIKDWADAYQWSKIPRKITLVRNDDGYNYYQIPADASCSENSEEIWGSFDDFKKQQGSKWLVSLPIEKNEWRKGTCDCSGFFEMYFCTHLIGLAIHLEYVVPPPEAKYVPTKEERKRGRPPKGKRAMIVL